MKKFILLCWLRFYNATESKSQSKDLINSNMIAENPKGTKRNYEECNIANKHKFLKAEINSTNGLYMLLYRLPSLENFNDTALPLTTYPTPQNQTEQEISGIDLLIQASEIIQKRDLENCNKVNEDKVSDNRLVESNNKNIRLSEAIPLLHKSTEQQNSHIASDLAKTNDNEKELSQNKIIDSNKSSSLHNPYYKSTIFIDTLFKEKLKISFQALLAKSENPKILTEEIKIILFFKEITKVDSTMYFTHFFDISFPIEQSNFDNFSSYTTKLIANPTLYFKYSLNFYFKSLEYYSKCVSIFDLENFILNHLYNYKALFRRDPRINFFNLTGDEKRFTLTGMKKYKKILKELSFISLILPEIKEISQIVTKLNAGSSVVVFIKSMLHITLKFIFDVKELHKLLDNSGSYNFKTELFRYRTFLFFGCAGLIHVFIEIKKQFILWLISYIDLLNEDLLNEPQLENTIKNVIIEGGNPFYQKSIKKGKNVFKFTSMPKLIVHAYEEERNMFDFEITVNDIEFIKELVKEHKDFVANFLKAELKSKIQEIYERVYKE